MLSVIVPVYQAVDTIERCVSSILEQCIDDMEVILVDDGSSDGSGELCDSLSEKYSNVIVKHITNSGPYQARRQGVLMARGDVVTTVDADDWLEQGAYNSLLNIYEKYSPDVLLFAYQYGQDGEAIFHEYQDGLYTKDRIEKEILPSMIWDLKLGRRRMDPSLCCKFIKRSLFLEATANVNKRIVWGEDAAVAYPVICLADRIYVRNKAYYHYCVSSNSCTRNYSMERIGELKDFQKVLKEKLALSSKMDFSWQADCYLRIFLNLLSVNWFGCNITSQRYLFPFDTIDKGRKIKIYGAGEVGKAFYQAIIQTDFVQLTGWYDKNADIIKEFYGMRIDLPDRIDLENDELILIAVANEKIARCIRMDLHKLGIRDEQIIWKLPILIG